MLSSDAAAGWRHVLDVYDRFCLREVEEAEWLSAARSLENGILLIPEAERSEAQGPIAAVLYNVEALELLRSWSSPVYDPVVHVWLAYMSFDTGDWEGVVREVELAQELANMNDAHFAKLWELVLVSKLNMDPAQVRPEDFDELVRRYSENQVFALGPWQLKGARGILESGGAPRDVQEAGREALRKLERLYERYVDEEPP